MGDVSVQILIIGLFSVSFLINVFFEILRLKSLKTYDTPEEFISYNFSSNTKYQLFITWYNLIQKTIVFISLLIVLLLHIPSKIDNFFYGLGFGATTRDLLTIFSLLFISVKSLLLFDIIKQHVIKTKFSQTTLPIVKTVVLWVVRFLIFSAPILIFILAFNQDFPNSNKVAISFVSTLIIGIISSNIYQKLVFKLNKKTL
jgi:hypothetical protein